MIAEQPIALTLEELALEVANLLEEYCLLGAARDNRVAATPDARTIRYYTSLGLLDRPKVEGRIARYGKRHLLQLLAIKALQAIGFPLSEIQARIYGRSDHELEILLASLSQGRKEDRKQESLKPVMWKEIVIEPGLKLLVEENWTARESQSTLEQRISAILTLLQAPQRSNGGETDE